MDPYNIEHLQEHFGDGVRVLAHGEGPLRDQFAAVITQCLFHFRDPQRIDSVLRPTWSAICKACSTQPAGEHGVVNASLAEMSDEDLEWLVNAFIDMANWIQRRTPEEHTNAMVRERQIPHRYRGN